MTAAKSLDLFVRIAGVLALALGLAFWGGRLHGLLAPHMALGLAAVIGLWGLAALALRRGDPPGLALVALGWGVATLALGPTQARLLPGDIHWLVRAAHLLLGLGAIALAAALARSLATSPPPAAP